MKERRLISLMLAGVMATSVGALAGCDTKEQYTMHDKEYSYVVVEENGAHILHKISDSSEYLRTYSGEDQAALRERNFKTECCDNEIKVLISKTTMYKNKPAEYAFDLECGLEK